MKKGMVSIITPMYNGERFVGQTIESVLAQTYPDWEMIVVDDGSKDGGAQIVEGYAKEDDRIKLIRQKNGGSACARNNGLRNATGRYICLLDSDDLWEPEFLQSQLDLMEQKSAAFVYSSHKRIDVQGGECLRPFIVPAKVTYGDLLVTNSISCLTAMYDSQKLGKHFLREELGSMRDDFAYWLHLIKICKVAYGNPKVLASYRVMSNSTTGNKKKLIKPQFMLYYKVEKLGLLRSAFYTLTWAVNGFFKYIR